VLTEWWYYTGHLASEDGRAYGFEFVIFQSVRASFPTGYLSHFAVTDETRQVFRYLAQSAQGRGVPPTLDLNVGGWRLEGGGGQDRFSASMDEYALELSLTAQKPAALHHGGLISFGSSGDSYYYSRTRMSAEGRLRDGDVWRAVTGQAWFDHQWGNFIVPAVGGWDWFSVQLSDRTELMLSVLRDERGRGPGAFGTYVDRDGRSIDIDPEGAVVEAMGSWRSPHTGADYPSGWRVRVPGRSESGLPSLDIELTPVLRDQELAWERMPYWEGAVRVSGGSNGSPVTGKGYVELTGYGP
jgi:predicted secreted hydrolase